MKKTSTAPELSPALKAMADPTRLRILLMLEAKPRTVGEIVTFFDLSQPTITRHLQALAAVGLVKRIRAGQAVRYELDSSQLRSVCISLVDCFPCCCVAVKLEPKQNEKSDDPDIRARRRPLTKKIHLK